MNGEFYIDGKKYISAGRAAKLTGYAMDYIGQLARNGKIDSKMIGRSWFVSEESLLGYKREVLDLIFSSKKSKKNSAKNRREKLVRKALAAAKKEAQKNAAPVAALDAVSDAPGTAAISTEPAPETRIGILAVPAAEAVSEIFAETGAKTDDALPELKDELEADAPLARAFTASAAEPARLSSVRFVSLEELRRVRAGRASLSAVLARRREALVHVEDAGAKFAAEKAAEEKLQVSAQEIAAEPEMHVAAVAAIDAVVAVSAQGAELPLLAENAPHAIAEILAGTHALAIAHDAPTPIEPGLVRGNVLPAKIASKKNIPQAPVRSPYWSPVLAASGSMLFGMSLALALIAVAPRIGALYDASETGAVAVGGGVHAASGEAKKILARSPLYLHAGVATVERSLAMNVAPDVAGTSPHTDVAMASSPGSILERLGAAISGYLDRVSLAMLDTGSKLLGYVPRVSVKATKLSTYASSSGEVATNQTSDSASGPSQGMAVVPSTGNAVQDQKVAKYIKDSFSDDVKIVSKNDDGTGVIQPVFKSGKKDNYLYVLVPLQDGS